MAKTYEELMGAIGRAMFFRPERRRVRDLLSRDAEAAVVIGGRTYELYDVSMNGLSFFDAAPARTWSVGEEVDIGLVMHGKRVWSARARIARFEPGRAGARVALGLDTGFLDLEQIHDVDEEGCLARELDNGAAAAFERVPGPYMEVMARAVHFLQYYKQNLDRHEARLRDQGAGAGAEIAALTERAADALRDRWTAIDREASRLALRFASSPEQVRAAKAYTETVVTPLLLGAPMVHRAYTKPLGYPGDFQVMLYYYENAFEGQSVFDRVFHKFFVEHPLSHGVRTRKQFVVDHMGRELERVRAEGGAARIYRVTSLGAGPAREVADFVGGGPGGGPSREWSGEIAWTLIDQEEETLGVAYHAGRRALATSSSRGSLSCLNVSFAQLLQEPALMRLGAEQDFIYCTGLFDYLRESRARALVEAMYERLAPGGLMAVGNALAPNEWLWSAELVLDWTLLYRSREEMLGLARTLPGSPSVEVVAEPGNAYWFLLVRKR